MRLLLILGDDILQQAQEQNMAESYTTVFSDYVSKLTEKHEVWIICNASFFRTVISLRRLLSTQISPAYFQTFFIPFDAHTSHHKSYQKQIIDSILKYISLQFSPQLVLNIHLPKEKTKEICSITKHRPHNRKLSLHNSQDKKTSLAYFAPLPPAKSGIASYSGELLPYLAQYYNITLVVDQEDVTSRYGNILFKTMSLKEFQSQADHFERKLYHFGNSYYHSYMWPLLQAYPGIVVLHDFFLSGLLSYEEINNGKELFWSEQLFKSHGYTALKERFHQDIGTVANRFPCNYEVIQHAQGIIVHSDYSKTLAEQWYTPSPLKPWKTIPLLRVPAEQADKKKIREQLGFNENDLIICSFGLLNDTKLNHRLLYAFLHSKLADDPRCHLIYVGEFTCETYADDLRKQIAISTAKEHIHITGWTEDAQFKRYLQAADIGVQFRAKSRGETSATVLDCMNYGLATIVNANGSMASLPKEVLFMLEDHFDDEDLTAVLEKLRDNPDLRRQMGKTAQQFIRKGHDPQSCAASYYHAIEMFHSQQEPYKNLIDTIAKTEALSHKPEIIQEISDSIARSTPTSISQRQLFIDVSAVVQSDLRTGIQRVVRAQLLELIDLAPHNVRVEPVYLSSEGGLHYRYARKFACKLLEIPLQIKEEPVSVQNGDIFYGLDFHWDGVIKAAQQDIYSQWAAAGVSISFVIYDLLPISYPEFFPEDAARLHHQWLEAIVPISDKLICISKAVANELRSWINSQLTAELDRDPEICVVHLGADIGASAPSEGIPDNTKELLDTISKKSIFLMVGTIEPRKGYLQTLAAFEHLWENGEDAHLVIVGKEGWKGLPDTQRNTIPEIIEKLRTHPRLNKDLFWFEEASDIFLEMLYHKADALIAASEDEGFGLPLIEAAHYALPIIARDTPVFREVASQSAYYFPNERNPEVLYKAVLEWMEAYRKSQHISSEGMKYINWNESAKKALEALLSKNKTEKYGLDTPSVEDSTVHPPEEISESIRTKEIFMMLLEETAKEKGQ